MNINPAPEIKPITYKPEVKHFHENKNKRRIARKKRRKSRKINRRQK